MLQKDFLERQIEFLAAALANVLKLTFNDFDKEQALKGIAALKHNMPSGDGRNLLLSPNKKEFETLIESPYFHDNKWTLLKGIRDVFETEADLLLKINDKENAAIALEKAEKIQTFLVSKGFFVWGEEDKNQQYQALKLLLA